MNVKQKPSLAASLHMTVASWKRCNIEALDSFWLAPQIATSTGCSVNATLGINVDHEMIRVEISADVVGLSGDNPLGIKGLFIIIFEFKTILIEDYLTEGVLDSLVASTVIGISYSTARGMILERTQGTFLGGVLIPIVNPSEILNRTGPPNHTTEANQQGAEEDH